MDSPDCHDSWRCGIEASRHDCLQREDQCGRADHGIQREVRARAVATASADGNAERVGGRRQRAGLGDYFADVEPLVHVAAEYRLHTIERSGLKHCPRTFTEFFSRLQHDHDVAFRRVARQQECRADSPGCVHIMAACVHDAGILRRKRQAGLFRDRKRVDVATNRDSRAAAGARDTGRQPRGCHAANVGGAALAQRALEALLCAHLLP